MMKPKRSVKALPRFFCFMAMPLFILMNSSCAAHPDEVDNICGQEPCYEGPFDPPWISGLVFPWSPDHTPLTHDNRVLETENFLVFSDASSDEAKIQLGTTAEACFSEIKQAFGISSSAELGISGSSAKMTIYSERNKRINPQAFSFGYIMYAYDSAVYQSYPPEWKTNHRDHIKHESTHVVQFYLGGIYERVHEWFTEGVAEYVSGGVYPPIACWPEVEVWRQDPGHVNPITVKKLNQIPQQQKQVEHYPLFGLAVRYLVEAQGWGKSLMDIQSMFADIRRGVDFAAAFEIHMGISLDHYEKHFYEMMKAFLPAQCAQKR